MKVRFTADAQLENEGPGKGPEFKAGEVYEMSDDQAQRWIRRGVAEAAEKVDSPYKLVKGVKAKSNGDDADEIEQSQAAAAKSDKEIGAEGSGMKAAHAVPHPKQSEPDSGPAKADFKAATAPKKPGE